MIRKTLYVLATSFFAVSAHAQMAGYASLTVSQMSNLQSSPYAAKLAAVDNSINPLGATLGGYYDFKTVGPLRLGADLRGVITTTKQGAESGFNGVGGKLESILGGVRGSFRTPFKALDGYVQGSAGLGRSNYGFPPAVIESVSGTTNSPASRIVLKNNVEYHAYVGAQLHVTPIADWRIFEVGYGALQGGGHSYPLKSVSTGLVFHFPTTR